MNSRRISAIVSIICLSLLLAGRFTIVHAGEPQEKVRQTINDVMAILRNESLKAPERSEERRAKIRQAVTERFGFEEMAKRAMGRHWRTLTAPQRQEFVPLFSDLLENSYIRKIESYVGTQELDILYTKESIDKEGYALVRTEIVNKRDLNFEIEYRLLTNKGNWEAYDIVIEGVSLVNNYRTQFNKIIRQESYDALVKKLQLKSEQVDATADNK
ncbi:MAG: ABC transporter substrate-binding protein [Candidatus Tectomicrobia bacterium]|nr:ABC transporter substrate-binding protein [Candidatus Tectomicrobia bacterium]